MKKFLIIMAMASVLPVAALVFGRCASADSTAQRETPARSTTAQENAGLAIQQVEIYPQIGPQVNAGSYVSFSPDGKWIISNGLWDAATGRELKRPYSNSIIGWSPDMRLYMQGRGSSLVIRNWETDAQVFTFQNISITSWRTSKPVFSPDGRQIAGITSDSNNIKVWDTSNGQELINITGSGIGCFAYSQDGRTILFRELSNDFNTVKAFDLVNKRQLRSFQTNKGNDDVFSPDGKRYILHITTREGGGNQHSIKIYDTETGRELRSLAAFNGSTVNGDISTNLAFHPDSKQIAFVERNNSQSLNTLKIFDVETGRELRSTRLEYDFNYGIAFSLDGRRLAYRSNWGGVIIMDAGNYREVMAIRSLDFLGSPSSIKVNYSNNKQAVFETNKKILLWDTETGRRVWVKPSDRSFSNIYFSPDKQFFANVEDQTNVKAVKINIYNTTTGNLVRSWQNIVNVSSTNELISDWELIWNQDGKELTCYVGSMIINAAAGTARYLSYLSSWNVADGQLISTNRHDRGTISGSNTSFSSGIVYFSPDITRILYIFTDSLQIYETRGTNKLLTITGSFNQAQWSPDGRRILTTSSDGTVRTWDAQTGRQLQVSIRHENIRPVQYSPDGRQIATGSSGDEYVRAWNAESGAMLWERRVYNRVDSISYSADGRRIIAVTFNSQSVYILDSTNGNVVFSSSNERSASYSPDGKWLITASQDGSVRILSAETFIEKVRLITFNDNEWLAMTPDGYYTASARGDQYLNARVGNTVTGIDRYRSTFNKPAVVQARLSNSGRMASHSEGIASVAVNPAGTRLATVSLDKTIKIWDLESGRELRSISNIGGFVNAISWSPDGRTLIHGAEDRTVRIWDAETGRAVRTINGHTDYVNEARYSPDGRRIASADDDKLIKIWDAETGREIRTLTGHTDMVGVVAWSPDGRRIASGTIEEEKTIRIWDVESGRLLYTIPNQGGRIMALAYSPDGRSIASCTTEEPMVKIWNAENGTLIKNIPIENRRPYSLAWNSDNKQLAVGYTSENSGYIGIFDTDTGTRIRQLFPSGLPYSINWTPDYRRIVAACNFSDGQFIRVYDALSGNEL
jgi:WD40 repeat protein